MLRNPHCDLWSSQANCVALFVWSIVEVHRFSCGSRKIELLTTKSFSAKRSFMAQMAQKLPITEASETRPTTVPVTSIPITGMPLNLTDLPTNDSASWLTEMATEIGAACGRASEFGAEVSTDVRDRARQFAVQIRDGAERVKDEEPLKVLAAFAGIAAVAGLVVRVWRSNRYE
jgi:hypothetical protein